MDFKNIFSNIVGSNKNIVEVPGIIIDNYELIAILGYWMGLISYDDYEKMRFYKNDAYLKKILINKYDLKIILSSFRNLLSYTEIPSNDICSISQYNRNKQSFNCHLVNSNEDICFIFSFGSFDVMPSLTVKNQNVKYIYEFYKATNERAAFLKKYYFYVYNIVNDNISFSQSYFSNSFSCKRIQGSYQLSINISNPDSNSCDLLSDYIYSIKEEEEFKKYLMGLTYPFDVKEIYKYICDRCLQCSFAGPVGFPKIDIEVQKVFDSFNSILLDKILVSYGNLKQYTRTTNNKTITVDGDDNWSYSSPTIIVKPTPYISENRVESIVNELNGIQKDVMEVRSFIKSLWR